MYTYDGLNQLKNMDRGDLLYPLTSPPTLTGAPVAERDFTFDATGNWKTYVEKTNGAIGLNQGRTHNQANEIGVISASVGTNWADPTYDRVGNMVSGPKPSSPANAYTFKYDAWNRLVEVRDVATGTLVGKYEYDGLHRRTKSHIDSQAPGAPNGVDKWRHFYYNSAWQIVETRLSTTGENTAPETLAAEYQWVWSARYIDAPVLRDRISDGQRLFFATDGNANVTSLYNTSAAVLERYTYDLYGQVSYYDGNWNPIGAGAYDNTILFGGYYRDGESGLHLARYRHLHSGLGRWLTRDPIRYGAGDTNLYRFVGNSPSRYADPFGLQEWVDELNQHLKQPPQVYPDSGLGTPRPPWSEVYPGRQPDPIGLKPPLGIGWEDGLWHHYWETAWNGEQAGSLAAWVDGFIPGWNPLEGSYDATDPARKCSKFAGGVSRDALLAILHPRLPIWAKNWRLYEKASTTVPPRIWAIIGGLSLEERGRWLATHYGVFGELWATWAFLATIPTGLTPGAWLATVGVIHGLDYGWETGRIQWYFCELLELECDDGNNGQK